MNQRAKSGFAETAARAFHDAHRRALETGLHSVEAEHLLLALAGREGEPCGVILREAGLTYAVIESALREERRRSLSFAGVEPLMDAQIASSARTGPVRVGASVKAALHRGRLAGPARNRPRDPSDVLRGIITAELGTVPRAFAIAGIDREKILSAVDEHTARRIAE